jgi:hypothetical protein
VKRPQLYISPGAMVGVAVSWLAIVAAFIWIAVNSATVANLHKTDRIACQLLHADVTTRHHQASVTQDTTLVAESRFISDADAFLELFRKLPANKRTAGTGLFQSYVIAERDLVAAIRLGTARNVSLSQHLSRIGEKLADQLHC